ncbi:hypothetical protein B0H10DRAFT_2379781 [Mycena sp. CBHHK59/15]|nr:hypothetical protein B0H10DRAFT_2379781 [Mycena sp. CBHHK59/15]
MGGGILESPTQTLRLILPRQYPGFTSPAILLSHSSYPHYPPSGIMFRPLSSLNSTVTLANLSNLELVNIRHPTSLLLDLHAPALQTLVIRNSRMDMGAFLSQWSHADFLPSNLRSLEFTECFSETHMPYLIRWLARLPSLLRLVLTHKDDIGDPNPLTSSVETDIFKALSSPDGAGSVVGGWLCPSLVHLCVDTNLRVVDIIPIARARGGAAARSSGLPSRLRLMQATLCSSGTEDEIAEFRSFFAEDSDAICLCLACGFNFSI